MAIKVELSETAFITVTKLKVSADVRYWEDAVVNGVEDTDGSLIPCRNGKLWEPVIDLQTGRIADWPDGKAASIHYKVCDAGEYYLLNDADQVVAKWKGHYVPDDLLCLDENGYGDYIIFDVALDGKIVNWKTPEIDGNDWRHIKLA